jgi:hypothetical protein
VPYLVHLVLLLGVLGAVAGWGAETRTPGAVTVRGLRLRIPSVRHPRFRRLVLPMAPWIFGAAGVAYAILPQAMAPRVGHWALLYATILTVATLGAGVLIQPLARRFDHAHRPRAIVVAMVAVTGGIGVAAAAVRADSPEWAALAAVLLGGSYGVALVAGLVEIQRISRPDDRAALTGVYYALAYVGFLFPTALAVGGRWLPTDAELAVLTLVALTCTLVVVAGRHTRPGPGPGPAPGAGAELVGAGRG